eukprot:6634978-Alexandrium_andersonii.AAC.1
MPADLRTASSASGATPATTSPSRADAENRLLRREGRNRCGEGWAREGEKGGCPNIVGRGDRRS